MLDRKITMLVVFALSATVLIALSAGVGAQQSDATVSFEQQTSGGSSVVVDEVTVPNGGFVTMHDETLGDGEVLGSVVGSSEYLEPGTHENVTVLLDEPIDDGEELTAMPHMDTDSDRIYDFVAENGGVDGPYTSGGEAVTESAEVTVSATVDITDQPTDGGSVVVDSVSTSEGGFVTVHDESLLEGEVLGSVVGVSEYLGPGTHENVRVEFDEEVESQILVPMPHKDTNGNEVYDFVTSGGSEDGAYLNQDGEAVVDTADVTVSDTASVAFGDQSTGGETVSVGELYLPDGGFVTVHDDTLVTESDPIGSVSGTSGYLEPGFHRNVVVPIEGDVTETMHAMPHMDTDSDETYDFVTSGGSDDTPYTDEGDIVMEAANVTESAAVSMSVQESDGKTVTVNRVETADGGFVAIHDTRLFEGEVTGSVIGASEYLEPGVHEDVEVMLDEPVRSSRTLISMPHRDTNDNQVYDFVTSGGAEDGPYVFDGGAVVDTAKITVNAYVEFEDQSIQNGSVAVDSTTLANGGFVTVHDNTLVTENDPIGSVLGTSEYLAPGSHDDVMVEIGTAESDTMHAMAHRDTNGNEVYDFVTSGGADDVPYTADGGIVMEAAEVTGTVSVTINNVGFGAWEVTEQDTMVADMGAENPTLSLETGVRYEFDNNGWSTHPFEIRDENGDALLSQSADGDFENDADVDWEDTGETFAFTVTEELAEAMDSYTCTVHSPMNGDISTSEGLSSPVDDVSDEIWSAVTGDGTLRLTDLGNAIQTYQDDPGNAEINGVGITLSDLGNLIQYYQSRVAE